MMIFLCLLISAMGYIWMVFYWFWGYLRLVSEFVYYLDF